MKITTTRLHLTIADRYRLYEPRIAAGLWGAAFATTLLLISTLLHPVQPPAPVVVHERAAILIATAQPQPPLPTYTPAPTPEPQVIERQVDVPVYQEPQVIYIEQAAPTAEPMAAPPADWYTDIATPEPAFVQAVTGADPNAPACVGANGKVSPLCGGLTNGQAAGH